MSTSPTFKYRGPDKRCPFPFDRDSATYLGSSCDYIALTASGGDEGLAEACRIWWLLESVTFSPSGTFGGFGYVSPPYTVTHPDEPVDRSDIYHTPTIINESGSSGPSSTNETYYNVMFILAYVSSEWRLYYSFEFAIVADAGGGMDVMGSIVNPEFIGSSAYGTFSLFGYTLDYAIYDPSPASGIGLTASSTFYTLV